MTRLRFPALISGLIAAIALIPLFVAPAATAATISTTPARSIAMTLVTDGFQAGNIISDANFFNTSTMSAAQIDTFLRSKLKTCQSGYTCLKDYRQNTPNRAADKYCKGYAGAASELSSTIIYKVAQSCGINPQVLLVMLQKEQSLVTWTYPDANRYAKAMGQGCPDTAGCDPQYAGFFYQVYYAARQLQLYVEGRYFTWYAPGKTWNILYHPTASRGCGTSPVYIQNAATSALYYYTPYQPNAAALRAGYGTGDNCSSYGNRNFYNYFKDWFGNPQGYSVSGGIYDVWAANGGASGWMGPATGAMITYGSEGWSQAFANADIYFQAGHGGTFVTSPVREEYAYVGGVTGGLSWPTINRLPVAGGAYQDFVGGRMYMTPAGKVFSVSGGMYTAHESVRNVSGPLGWPSGRSYRTADGWRQDFDSGAVLQSARGAVPITSDFISLFDKLGGYGQFGSATSTVVTDAVGTHVAFTGGWIQKQGTQLGYVKGPLGAAYLRNGAATGPLGYMTGAEHPLSNGVWTQQFQGGDLYDMRSGVYAVTTFAKELAARGGPDAFGYPSGDEITSDSRRWQLFGRNSLGRASATSPIYVVKGAIVEQYIREGTVKSFLGAPIGLEQYISGGWAQKFEGGVVYYSGAGAFSSPKAIAAVLDQNGGVTGRLGWPTTPATTTSDSARQVFGGGGIFISPAGAFTVKGALGVQYLRLGAEKSSLGWPVANEEFQSGEWLQRFQNGTLVYKADGTFQVR